MAPSRKALGNTRKGHPSISQKTGWSDRKKLVWILSVTFAFAALLLFARLGHYSLWDDESMDALSAQSILETGATTGKVGHNLVAYRHGLLLMKNKDGSDPDPATPFRLGMPPLTAYCAALSMGIFGQTAWAVRLPSALFGLACVGVMLWWLWKNGSPPVTAAVFAIALLGNVSFFLYARQCRYYGVSMFLFVLISYLYLHENRSRRRLLLLGVALAALMLTNPLFFVIFSGCIFCDYVIWQRKVRWFSLQEMAILFVPQVLAGLSLLKWWNPLHTQQQSYLVQNTIGQRFTLFLWNLRDMNRCEMILGGLLLIAVIMAFSTRHQWLKRSLCAFFLYVLGMTVLSTQTIKLTSVADVRYLSAILPLCIAIEVLAFRAFFALITPVSWHVILFAVVAFFSNFAHGGLFYEEGLRSTLVSFAGELMFPPGDPYTLTAGWINQNVREGESVFVLPEHMMYPLIFHAPKAVYAWQLIPPPEPRFSQLPSIHFAGAVPPDYIIAFGPVVRELLAHLKQWNQVAYEPVASINYFWKDAYRPELFWRRFEAVQVYNPQTEAIYILKRKTTLGPN